MKQTLTPADFQSAAAQLGCDVESVQAVCEVEAPEGGFLPDGRTVILFERHHFRRFTKAKFDVTHPQISNIEPGGYKGGAAEWERYQAAYKLDKQAAMLSTSWGRFQIMGFNFALVGFPTVEGFIGAMNSGEPAQLGAFVEFVKAKDLDDELQRHDWKGFARGYNGKNYAKNKYDSKMAAAYKRIANLPDEPEPPPIEDRKPGHSKLVYDKSKQTIVQIQEQLGEQFGEEIKIELPITTSDPPPIQASVNGHRAWNVNLATQITSAVTGAVAIIRGNQWLIVAALTLAVVALVCWYVRGIVLDRERMRIAADRNLAAVK